MVVSGQVGSGVVTWERGELLELWRSVASDSNVSTLKNSPFLERNIFSGFRADVFSVIPTLFAFQESE